ncbi:MAG: hypothetical protein COU85_01080 [Candidatus Portnoybacteria bacterium CG10_big_fil_rev_8_21_14_0_10_44_7]|uniref:Phospholipase C/D domain-containing protein n=1 Tax=Candidatus Portnoybacteria bacterium CG10_big_fil_rev_8_21_14_0_10_44_7 TaxID=1974816 RepID=A0A2M8KJ09_9BACT|nr:MAG: hypothetical protein COU85_01080 [Candidatus Portnoybacteria bacterium CG10_big_fil_rev_8_21_14_0_10_44_7]
MDIFAHGLWPLVAAKAAKKKIKLNLKAVFFWGVFPDLFAFTPIFAWLLWRRFFTGQNYFNGLNPQTLNESTNFMHGLTNTLYQLSHSLIVATLIILFVAWIFRQKTWPLLAWLLHILIDIPTHSLSFYPTPFLWPISDFRFAGLSWAQPWFLVINYSALVLVFSVLFIAKRKKLINKN